MCETLAIPVGSLFHASTGEIVRREDYPPINFGGVNIAEYLLTPQGERRVQAILSEIAPGGGSGDELYGLPADVEFVYVIEGRLQVTLRAKQIVLEAGDAFTFPPRNEHCFRSATDDGTTRVLWVFAPALPPDAAVNSPQGPSGNGSTSGDPTTNLRRRRD